MREEGDEGGAKEADSISSLPSFVSFYVSSDGCPLNSKLLYASFICDECEQLKSDVVGYTLPAMFLTPRAMRFDYLVKCRRCMRMHILSRLWLVIILAHVFSPLIVIWWGFVFVQTFYRKPG